MITTKEYVTSLLAKSFIILTGTTGTGKTRISIRLSELFSQVLSDKIKESPLLTVNKEGEITNKTEGEIARICAKGNQFLALINGQHVKVQIIMANYLEILDEDMTISNLRTCPTNIRIFSESLRPIEDLYAFVPVGADWTDSSHLLGYLNPFGQNGQGRYEIGPALRLILKALHSSRSLLPHFLILDEMNLSHVERYFHKFLSVMEGGRLSKHELISLLSREEVTTLAQTVRENANEDETVREVAMQLADEGKPLLFPANLFIVGTVNVDETTYMFSPKVLDRAHVLEMKPELPSSFLKKSKNEDIHLEDAKRYLKLFQDEIQRRRNLKDEDPLERFRNAYVGHEEKGEIIDVENKLIEVLDGLFRILEPAGFQFGYRTIREVIDYFVASKNVDTQAVFQDVLQKAIIQKILPKIHGNRRQLESVFDDLDKFCNGEEVSVQIGVSTFRVPATGILLEMCLEKILEMKQSLDFKGYASFI